MVACRITDARNIAANNHHHHQPSLHQQQLALHRHTTPHQQQQQQQQHLQQSQHIQQQHQHHLQQMHNRNTGSISASQVPLKKYKETRISSLTTILIAILHWIWPPDRCNNCHSIYSSPHEDEEDRQKIVTEIQRSRDGRFVLVGKTNALTNGETAIEEGIDEVDGLPGTRNSNASQKSSSDDGGFLSRRSFITARASWRRPLVQSPSQLSLQSVAAGSARGFLQGLGGLLKIGGSLTGENGGSNMNSGARYQNVHGNNLYRNLQSHHHLNRKQHAQSASRPLHINTISGTSLGHHMHQVFSPSKVSRLFSSSPASTANGQNLTEVGLLTSPWAMTTPSHTTMFAYNNVSDLSTVYPGSAERSVPTLTPTASGNLSRYRYYTHELPSLRTIQEETRRLNYEQQQQQEEQQQHQQEHRQEYMALQLDSPPSCRSYYQHSQAPYYHSYRPRTRWYPRHYSRLFGRPQSDLLSPLPHLNLSMRTSTNQILGLDASPESRSSSSGFGSKNTFNHPQGSHNSGSTSEWRLLPPYRPPPPPPLTGNTAYFGTTTTTTNTNSSQQPQQAQGQAPVFHNHQQHHRQFNTLPSSYQPYSPSNYFSSSTQRTLTPPYTMEHWLDMITRLNAATDNVNLPKSVDVGSVDGHYEFDPSTPTPSASTPTTGILREDLNLHVDTTGHHLPQHHHHHHHHLHQQHNSHNGQHYYHNHNHSHSHQHGQHGQTLGTLSSSSSLFQTKPSGTFPPISGSATFGGTPVRKSHTAGRYDNIEARLQAMKEEFYEYRKKQAMQRAGVSELESVC